MYSHLLQGLGLDYSREWPDAGTEYGEKSRPVT
jgi:hypothetical protein